MSSTPMARVFGSYDIRGLYGTEIDDQFAYRLGFAIAKYVSPENKSTFLIGYDSRKSSPRLADFLTQALCEAGQEVTVMGMSATPRVYWEGASGIYDCTIAITASHLSAAHNGFKICIGEAEPLSAENGLRELELHMTDEPVKREGGTKKSYSSRQFEAYISVLKEHLKPLKTISIVVDGGGSPIGPEVMAVLDDVEDVTLHGIDLQPDGAFLRRSPNPLDQGAIDDLAQMTVETRSAFGVAFDGDGDRIVVVDEKGNFAPPDLITALIAESILKEKPGSNIMYDLRSSRAVPEYITKLGGQPLKSRVGHSLIKKDMREKDVVFSGELSAHYYWSDLYYTDNAVRVLIELINVLSATTRPLSALLEPLRTYSNSGEINFKTTDPATIMKKLATTFNDGEQSWVDGLSVEYASWWFNARASQTEPCLRLCVGSATGDELELRVAVLTSLIKD
jgi:phosphomannomutase